MAVSRAEARPDRADRPGGRWALVALAALGRWPR